MRTGSEGGCQDEVDAEEDPFAPLGGETNQDPFLRDRGSDSEDTCFSDTCSDDENNMESENGPVPEDEDDETGSDEAFGEEKSQTGQRFKSLESRRKDDVSDASRVTDASQRQYEDENTNPGGKSVSEDRDDDAGSRLSEDESNGDVDTMDMGHSEASSDLSGFSPPTKKTARRPTANGDRAALRALLSSDTAAVASSISAAASADARKGRAVKAQYQTFDRLLDARIKLQKGLTAANSITPVHELSEHRSAITAAEEAALTLWNTIVTIRHAFAEAQSQTHDSGREKKRKRPPPATPSTPLSALCSSNQSLFSTTVPHHRTILNRWSAKMRASNPIATEPRSRLFNESAGQNSITDMIDGYLATEAQKLIAQSTSNTITSTTTSNPASNCGNDTDPATSSSTAAAAAAADGPSPTPKYDDTTFYQTLLRDLIASRSATSAASSFSSSTTFATTISATTKLHPSGSRNKNVDTKASKGRKVRYDVHERLQNFMAAEGGQQEATATATATGWSEAATNEFFASLMGGAAAVLDEDGDGDGDGDGAVLEDRHAEKMTLRLF